MKKLILALSLAAVCIGANAFVAQGETSAGVYTNMAVSAAGKLTTTATAATVTVVDGGSGSIAVNATAQTALVANPTRAFLLIQNTSDTTMWFNFTTTAVQAQPSIQLIAGASMIFSGPTVPGNLISVIGPTAGKTFTIKEF